ncbi:MAG: methyltransferase family protein [Candidatus Binataceae bacterium]
MENGARARAERAPLRAVIGTLIFAAVLPPIIYALIPYELTRWRFHAPFLGSELTRWLGVAMIAVAVPPFAEFFVRFVREGHGTPAPIAPTERLVVGGTYRYVRNPAYLCVIALILGQALLFGSGSLLVYAAVVWLGFHIFVVVYEEPTLRRQFDGDYERYCREVPRWIPRFNART